VPVPAWSFLFVSPLCATIGHDFHRRSSQALIFCTGPRFKSPVTNLLPTPGVVLSALDFLASEPSQDISFSCLSFGANFQERKHLPVV
jgi:hypothetical protein